MISFWTFAGILTCQSRQIQLINDFNDEPGRFTAKQFVVDATLVKANASMSSSSLVKREDADPDVRSLKQYEQRYQTFSMENANAEWPVRPICHYGLS